MNTMEISLTSLALCFLTSACVAPATDSANVDDPTNPELQRFELLYERPRTVEPSQIDRGAVGTLTEVNTTFAVAMYQKLRDDEGVENVVFSPFGISRAFSNYFIPGPDSWMDPDLFAAYEAVFGFTEETTSETTWQELTHLVSARTSADKDAPSIFESSDIYWVQPGAVDTDKQRNLDRVHGLDFGGEPEVSRGIINDWIADRSKGALQDFISPGDINQTTYAVTNNVVFFSGSWISGFAEYGEISFETDAGVKPLTQLSATAQMGVAIDEDLTVVSINYNDGYNFVILMPTADHDRWAQDLTAEILDGALASIEAGLSTLKMPAFSAQGEPNIVVAIKEMRVESNTAGGGTLTGAHTETFVHKAVIDVNKDGTTAAAATAIIENENSAPSPVHDITIDRPFTYLITDTQSGAILFLGEFNG
jgi:serine protease inhibitor